KWGNVLMLRNLADRGPVGLARAMGLWAGASLAALSFGGSALGQPADARLVEVADKSASPGAIIVTARQRPEDAQKVPGSLSVVSGQAIEASFTNNMAQTAQLVPSLNYGSPNPRNTSFTVRGLGSSVVAVSQANDGLEPGVGYYVDQVYHARPATAAFDFTDIERIEVLRGPQGTVFGKNTTAGAINITSRAPTFTPEGQAEISYGDYQYVQVKAAVSGPIAGDKIAVRLFGALTRRDGVIENVRTGKDLNDVHNDALRGQILFKPNESFQLKLSADYVKFKNTCCTQVYVRVGTTLKPAARQYPALAAGQNYTPPSLNPYDRKTDIDASLGVDTDEGGVSAIADWNLGPATLTSVSAWRWWNWDAANDRDYTGLQIQTVQHIPSRQDQYSQEIRLASNGENAIDYVVGAYWFNQAIKGRPITAYGSLAAYWLLGPAPTFPSNLLDGYYTDGETKFLSNSYAAFGEATWHATSRLSLTGGLRYTDEQKDGRYDTIVAGGLATTNTTLINNKLSILRPQSYRAAVDDGSLSGRANISYALTGNVMAYAGYARGQKSGGINMSGLPLDAANTPALATAVIRPEKNTTYEIGVKTGFFDRRLMLNLDAYDAIVRDFQTNVVDTGPGALRGYLANIPKVEVKGFELDANLALNRNFSAHLYSAYADGQYVSYKNGPCPLELIGNSTTVCDLSGKPLSALPRWVVTLGGEYAHDLAGGEGYIHAEATRRTKVYGDPADSIYTVIAGYTLVNASVGYRRSNWEVALFARNLFDEDYIQNLTIQAGNSGLVVGTPSDPRLVGVTLRARY
ncbi:MAG TPA: TonB-dependent receptor, partial [Caulobacterales bacterium]|nr:TonB-dependent receptor [Caulobacterales bacterium]